MRKSFSIVFTIAFMAVLVSACSLPQYGKPQATPTLLVLPTQTAQLLPTVAASQAPTAAPISQGQATVTPNPFPTLAVQGITPVPATQSVQTNFCTDGQVTTLINNFKTALQNSDGTLLASLVSPVHGMDARLYRDGRVVNYDRAHAKFLFDSTFSVNWGSAPGSGLETTGSFHETIVPALLDVFNKKFTLTCNQIKVGGTTYQAAWPYKGINYYSVYYAGSQGSGSLDWHTWLLGVSYTNGTPYLYAIMQFRWEP
jgi:hypothetical protein